MGMTTGQFGGASMAIPLLLFVVCFPQVVAWIIFIGLALLFACALAALLSRRS